MSAETTKTEPLYYSDPERLSFEATVVEVGGDEHGTALVLDRTAFYPEGGGQPADRGTLNGVAVRDVQKRDGVVHHHLAGTGAQSFKAGDLVTGEIDGRHRFEYMQQHTGQHVISAAFHRLFEYATVSVHQGEAYTTVELATDSVAPRELTAVQHRANEVIRENLAVSAVEVGEDELDGLPLRREPKVAGVVRVVRIGEFDCAACGGLHAARTGLLQLVNCVGVERIRGRVRTIWKIGDRALADYAEKTAVVNQVAALFSAQQHDLVEKARKHADDAGELQRRLGDTERRLAGELAARLRREAENDAENGAEQPRRSGAPLVVTERFREENAKFMRAVVDRLVEESGTAVCVVNRTGNELRWWIGVSDDCTFEFDEHRTRLLAPIAGKGGGRRPVWQGAGTEGDAAGERGDTDRAAGQGRAAGDGVSRLFDEFRTVLRGDP